MEDVHIPIAPFAIEGRVTWPEEARALVIFAQGTGKSRPGHRGALLAAALQRAGIGSAWLDLLSPHEGEVDEDTHVGRFDAYFLAGRLVIATDWLVEHGETRGLPLAYVGVGAGAGAALVAAAERPAAVAGVVSWDGGSVLAQPPAFRAILGLSTPALLLGHEERPARQTEIARDWLSRTLDRALSPLGRRS